MGGRLGERVGDHEVCLIVPMPLTREVDPLFGLKSVFLYLSASNCSSFIFSNPFGLFEGCP